MNHIYRIEFKRLNPDAQVPRQGSAVAAGYDLHASSPTFIPPGGIGTISLGFATVMPDYIHGRIESRSGMALRGHVVLTGVIDADYRGEWKVIMGNFTKETLHVETGDRIAQVVFRPTLQGVFSEVSELSESSRGVGGFGSTGTR